VSSADFTTKDPGFKVRGIHHVAFAHKDRAVIDGLESLFGFRCDLTEEASGFVERMFRVGGGYVQTLEATGPGVVDRFIGRRGPALHHVAFEVEDIDVAFDELKRRGTKMVDDAPRQGGGGTRIAFVHPSACGGLLVELVEAKREAGS
jgi:methylmalonyl-CoA/ethylmalonyl-CoA epimerase